MPRPPRPIRPPRLSKEERRAQKLAQLAAWKAMTPQERIASIRAERDAEIAARIEARNNANP